MSSSEFSILKNRANLAESLVNSLISQINTLKSQLSSLSPLIDIEISKDNADEKKATNNDNNDNNNTNNNDQKRPPRAIDVLGARMKTYEEKAKITKNLDPSQPLIVRLDGHCFHTFARGFQRPFDKNLHKAMVLTTADLVTKYQAYTGYTQSDEITLIFPAMQTSQSTIQINTDLTQKQKKEKKKNDARTHLFGGRTLKISSVLSGYCSARFNYHLINMFNNGIFNDINIYNDNIRSKVISCSAHFDGRSFNVPNNIEVLNNIMWRCYFDCRRNSIAALARHYFSQKELNGRGGKSKLEMLKNQKNVVWETDTPAAFRYGTFVKKELFDMEFMNPKTKEKIMAKRTKVTFTPIGIEKFDEMYIELLLDKYWTKKWKDKYQSTMQSVARSS